MGVEFTEDNIQLLFGNEAAECEDIERLRSYYFKNSIYNRVLCNAAVRILVGHKGVGKSALFKVGIAENSDNGDLPILVRPDDINEIASEDKELLKLIRDWKAGLKKIIAERALLGLGLLSEGKKAKIGKVTGSTIQFLEDSVKKIRDTIDLEPAKKRLVEHFLEKKKIIVYIDDLDRGWEGRPFDIKRISALLNAIRDLSSDTPGLQFRLSLRSDVYYLVRTSDESTDKIEGSVIWYNWTNHEILIMLIKRIESFFGREIDEDFLLHQKQAQIAHYMNSIFEPKFSGTGHWNNAPIHKILMSLIRKRPRDIVKLCTSAARCAASSSSPVIRTKHLESVFEDYSQGRVQDTINEYKTELPDLGRLILGMRPTKKEVIHKKGFFYTTDKLFDKLKSITACGGFTLSTKRNATPKDLAHFLYKINFLIATKLNENGHVERKYFEESRYLCNDFIDFGYAWEVHPAYRWALQPNDILAIMENLHQSVDE